MFLSGTALVTLSPLLIIVCILELVFHGRPVIYCTRRPRINGKIYSLHSYVHRNRKTLFCKEKRSAGFMGTILVSRTAENMSPVQH